MDNKITKYNASTIRELFLEYFENLDHQSVESSSLLPENDPTLLFTTAGMVQMKPYFLGDLTPSNPNMASVQKCLRTTDIDEVGDTTHLTFFEMLGNFSVGDYFKKEAIVHAWKFITEEIHLDPDRLWVTVYTEDDEAASIWESMGVSADRIYRFDEKDNYWGPAGDSGPCGPCSEIHYDLTPNEKFHSDSCGPNCECGRFVELWNLVFMEYFQDTNGSRSKLDKPNIDTGMGLERLAAILQGVDNVYETDLFSNLIAKASSLANIPYGKNTESDKNIRTMVEHTRAAVFLICDGVIPGNENQSYVLRRIIRRAIRAARNIGIESNFIEELSNQVYVNMELAYPKLTEAREHITSTLVKEEEQFNKTLRMSMALMDKIVEEAKQNGDSQLSGQQIFRLYDTYGLPIEIAEDIAANHGLSIDKEEFKKSLEAQQERGRGTQEFVQTSRLSEGYKTLASLISDFVGYKETFVESQVTGLIVGGGIVTSANVNHQVEIVTRKTAFYPEGGGQLSDIGVIQGPEGVARVTSVIRPVPESHNFSVHIGVVESGTISVGDTVTMEVDTNHRQQTTRHHTATHLLHSGLRHILGDHVRQAGSLVAPDHLRFDFSHNDSIDTHTLTKVADTVNTRIMHNIIVQTETKSINDALDDGALAFFGDRYEEMVRTVSILGNSSTDLGIHSYELCGGTHVESTGQIGYAYVTSEGTIGSGVHRIEAVAGESAQELLSKRLDLLGNLAANLNVSIDDIESRIDMQIQDLNSSRKTIKNLNKQLLHSQIPRLKESMFESQNSSTHCIVESIGEIDSQDLILELVDILNQSINDAVIIIGAILNDKPYFVCSVSPNLVGKGEPFHAARLIKDVAAEVKGGGGGKAEMATAGGKDKNLMDQAIKLGRSKLLNI